MMGFREENSIVSRETLWPEPSPYLEGIELPRRVVLCFAQLFPETPLSEKELV
jgi:hypothetical protein